MKILMAKPRLLYKKSEDGAPVQGDWTEIDTPKQDTTTLETNEGTDIEAYEEGGELVERVGQASTYNLGFELFVKKGTPMLFSAETKGGVVEGEYAFRVISGIDPSAPAFQIDRAIVKAARQYSPNDSYRVAFTVMALKPASGDTIKDLYYDTGKQDYTTDPSATTSGSDEGDEGSGS